MNAQALELIEQPEEWRPVVGYEGLYSVSSAGRMRAEARLVVRRNGNYIKKAAPLSPGSGVSKYKSLLLTKDGVTNTHYVHHLVLLAFAGPKPKGHEACHGDGDRQNNRADNLRWDTRAANHADKKTHGTATQGESHPMSKLNNDLVTRLRRRRAEGASITTLANEFSVSRMTASRAAAGKSWGHIQ